MTMPSVASVAVASSKHIPSLKYTSFTEGNDDERRSFCYELLDAMSELGFVKLTDHGLRQDDIDTCFDMSRRFFALPENSKKKAAHASQPNPHRGYSHVGQENISMITDFVKGNRNQERGSDLKETYDFGPAIDEKYPNLWIDEADISGFRMSIESFYEQCRSIHDGILQALEESLNLERGIFQNKCAINNMTEFRLTHYPACNAAHLTNGVKRISEHTDFGTVTLLFQDSIGGLEAENRDHSGSFFPVTNDGPSEIVVNIGDCMQRWTNDRLHAVSHRVVLPMELKDDPAAWAMDRYSISYFGKPDCDQSVGVLKDFVNSKVGLKYEDMTALEWNQAKLVRTY